MVTDAVEEGAPGFPRNNSLFNLFISFFSLRLRTSFIPTLLPFNPLVSVHQRSYEHWRPFYLFLFGPLRTGVVIVAPRRPILVRVLNLH